jgi:hypothetical protein
MLPTIAARFPSKNEDPSQETPTIEITATIPPRMMLPFNAASGEALNAIIENLAVAIMMIIITAAMLT